MTRLARQLIFILAPILLMLCACAEHGIRTEDMTPAISAEADTRAFSGWLDAEFEEYLDFSPMTRTRLGDKKDYDKMDDVSESARLALLEWRRTSVHDMKQQFDRDALTAEGKRSWDLWLYLLERSEANQTFKRHGFIFGRYGPQSGLPRHFLSYQNVDSAADMDAYIARMEQAGSYLRQYLDRAKLAADDGIRAPYFDYDRAISESKRVLAGEPFGGDAESALWKDATAKINRLFENNLITADEALALTQRVRTAMTTQLQPAYQAVIEWLEADRRNLSEVASGASSLPDGKAYYQYALLSMTTLPLTADEVHETGLSEVARIHAEMNVIKDKVGFDGTLNAFFVHLRESDEFYYPSTDEGRAAYIAVANQYLSAMKAKLPEYFGLLPKADLEVKRVEAFREQAGGAAHYSRGTPDGARPGVFYAHLIDMRTAAKYRLENLAYHEGIPGHHLQISIQQELENIPRFRQHHGFTAFSEGWGLYAELMGKDMGFYQDPYSDFGRLAGELWRAVRLVVDTGIHAKGWSEQEAIDYAILNSPWPAAGVKSEVQRYFNNPGQATAYKIGMLKIVELRQRAMDKLGNKFDYRRFHDAVLGSGPLPLTLLDTKIDEWIATER